MNLLHEIFSHGKACDILSQVVALSSVACLFVYDIDLNKHHISTSLQYVTVFYRNFILKKLLHHHVPTRTNDVPSISHSSCGWVDGWLTSRHNFSLYGFDLYIRPTLFPTISNLSQYRNLSISTENHSAF